MKLIIAGTRSIGVDSRYIIQILTEAGFSRRTITEVVSGNAMGIDLCGEKFAKEFNIPIKLFRADWEKYGRSAGPKRNRQMAMYGDFLLLIWDGKSRGSANMLQEANNAGIGIIEVDYTRYKGPE